MTEVIRKADPLLSAVLVLFAAAAQGKAEETSVEFPEITLKVNNSPVEVQEEPLLYDGKLYLPVELVVEALKADMVWQPDTQTLSINGRVFVRSESVQVRRRGQNYTPEFSVLVVNSLGDTVSNTAVGCRLVDSKGRVVTEGRFSSERDIAPGGSVTHRFSGQTFPITAETPDPENLRPECEVVHFGFR